MTRILKFSTSFLALGLMATTALGYSVDVVPSYAPNGGISPNWSAYGANAISSLRDNLGNIGDRTVDASAYELVGAANVHPSELIVTPFNSWRGQAAPTAGWDGPSGQFAGEFGNRIHFGLHVTRGDGDAQFSLSDIMFTIDSDDPVNTFDDMGTLAGRPYDAVRVGIDYVDGIKGNGNDIIYNSGEAGTTLIDELIYVGVGTGYFSDNPAANTDQEDIDLTLASNCLCPTKIKVTYQIKDDAGAVVGMGMNSVMLLPEPASALAGIVGLGFCLLRRRNGLSGV